jgi:hypothetical protein
MSALAIFKLKLPPLLEFDKHRKDEAKAHNLKSVFGITNIPSGTQMRTILDSVPYKSFFKIFNKILSLLQGQKALNQFKYGDNESFKVHIDNNQNGILSFPEGVVLNIAENKAYVTDQ